MINSDRLRKIKSLQDIKLEKAKYRYELLLAENRLFEHMVAIQNQFTFPLFLSKVKHGFVFASKIVSSISSFTGWLFRKKGRSDQTEFQE